MAAFNPSTSTLLSGVAAVSTTGNSISVTMNSFLDNVKNQPLGFRELGLDFLSISQILNSLERSLTEHFNTSQPFPEAAVPELMRVVNNTSSDFSELEKLLNKFMDFEKGGMTARVQKTWRQFFADKDIAKVQKSLREQKGSLNMAMLLTNISPAMASTLGDEYKILAAKLEQVEPAQSYSTPPPGYVTAAHPPSGYYAPSTGQPPHTAMLNMSMADTPTSQGIHELPTPDMTHAIPALTKTVPTVTAISKTSQEADSPPPPQPGAMPIPPIALVNQDTAPPAPQPGPSPAPPAAIPPPEPALKPMKAIPVDKTPEPLPEPVIDSATASTKKPIKIERSQLQFRQPKTASTAASAALQKTLYNAVLGGKANIVEQLLDRGVSPDTGADTNAVYAAVDRKDIPILQLLLEFGANPDLPNQHGNTPLYMAAFNRVAETKLLLSYGADPNLSTPHWTAIPWAIDSSNAKIVQLHIDHSADPNLVSKNGETAIVYACSRRFNEAVLAALFTFSPNANVPNGQKITPLKAAVAHNQPQTVAYLLKKGVDVNSKDSPSPLLEAAHNPAVLTVLLEAGADWRLCPEILELSVWHNALDCVKALLAAGMPADTPNPRNNFTPLSTAARDNRQTQLALLLQHDANPNLKGQELPLVLATPHATLLTTLLQAGADWHLCPEILELSVWHNKLDSTSALLAAGIPVDTPNPKNNFTALSTAARDNRAAHLALLLEAGANPNLKGQDFPIVLALQHPEALSTLLSAGADPSLKPGICELAVIHNRPASLKALVEAGANINAAMPGGYTALSTSVRDKRRTMFDLCLQLGADVNYCAEGHENMRPLRCAADKEEYAVALLDAGADVRLCANMLENVVYFNNLPVLKLLVERGRLDVNASCKGYYPVDTAIRDNHPEILAYLLSHGGSVDKLGDGDSPLVRAAREKNLELVKTVLAAGAKVDAANGKGKTALASAAWHGKGENVTMLLEAGADANLANADGLTAMDAAANQGHEDIVMMLLEKM